MLGVLDALVFTLKLHSCCLSKFIISRNRRILIIQHIFVYCALWNLLDIHSVKKIRKILIVSYIAISTNNLNMIMILVML